MRNNLSEHIETKAEQAPKEPKAKKGSKAFVQILNGEFLSREFIIENLGFIFYLMLLLLLIVGKGYYVKQLSDDVLSKEKQLDETVSDYVEMKVKFEESTMRGKLVEKMKGAGLVESIEPPKVIRITKKEH